LACLFSSLKVELGDQFSQILRDVMLLKCNWTQNHPVQWLSFQSLIMEARFEFQACLGFWPRWRYLYIFLVVGLVWSNEPESYASSSLISAMVSYDGHV